MDRIVEIVQQAWGDIQINISYINDQGSRQFIQVTLLADNHLSYPAANRLNEDGQSALNRALRIAQAFRGCIVNLNPT